MTDTETAQVQQIRARVSREVEWCERQAYQLCIHPGVPVNLAEQNLLLDILARQQAEIDRLRGERDTFYMDYRIKSDELSKAALVRAESAESSLSALREALKAEIAWMDERRNAPGITTLGMIQERLRALLASPTPEDPKKG